MRLRKLLSLFYFLAIVSILNAQDLNARVQVLAPQIQSTNKRIFDLLQKDITEFLNNRKWSEDNIGPQERIDCNFVLNISKWDEQENFEAEVQIQSSRPIYGTTYNSVLLNISDKNFAFQYREGQSIEFSDQNYISNLASLLAYYAYVIVGMDYDSFSAMGGTKYYQKAQSVLNVAQNSPYKGWKAFEDTRNRYWLVENLLNRNFSPIREVLYEYHLKGLDVMSQNTEKGRKVILNLLPKIQRMDRMQFSSVLNQAFFTAKADELISIFSTANPPERMRVMNLLSEIDPANAQKYQDLSKQKF